MNEDLAPCPTELMASWLQMSDEALRDSQTERNSNPTRCSAALAAGYACALHLIGPDAAKLGKDHPSERVLRTAAEVANVDVGPALLHLERQLHDPVNMPRLEEMSRWAHLMRRLVAGERA